MFELEEAGGAGADAGAKLNPAAFVVGAAVDVAEKLKPPGTLVLPNILPVVGAGTGADDAAGCPNDGTAVEEAPNVNEGTAVVAAGTEVDTLLAATAVPNNDGATAAAAGAAGVVPNNDGCDDVAVGAETGANKLVG